MIAVLCALALQQPVAPIRGFPRAQLAGERRREEMLAAVPRRDTLRAQMELLSAVPHEAGTERSRAVAERILARWRSFGLDAKIEQFEALMPRPLRRTLELVAPERYTALLKEPTLSEDPTSGQTDQLPTFNAYSPDGDVTGELVYVNYGVPADYRILDSLGVSVKGKIVIARYGGSWRGIKPKVAAEHGAIGCLMMDMPTYPGDPLTPGWGAVPGSRKLARADVKTIEPIPVLPISYGDALPLLKNLSGPTAPERWRGALPITYHIGGGPARVHLAVQFDWQVRPLYDVIATIPGAAWPDQWVIYGNHHDAWVNGANDPISGQVALGETARGLGTLLKSGWRPARTIVLAAWDGEEWGLLGSTEWAETHAAELATKGVAYYNSDTNDRGWLGAAGSHALETFVAELARDMRDPATGKSVLDAWRAHQRNEKADTVFHIDALGSGSDYTAFIDHLGVASLSLSYGGATHDGIYHSIYDTYTFYERFLDTSFVYGVAESQTMGAALLRMADAPVLPFDFTAAARTYRGYTAELDSLAGKNDSTKALDLTAVRAALTRLDSAAARYERALVALDTLPDAGVTARRRALADVNRLLYTSERALADSAGLPRRPWFTHLAYAPGYYTGYGVKTLPGIREALEQHQVADAQAQAARVAQALGRYADQVDRATGALAAALK